MNVQKKEKNMQKKERKMCKRKKRKRCAKERKEKDVKKKGKIKDSLIEGEPPPLLTKYPLIPSGLTFLSCA